MALSGRRLDIASLRLYSGLLLFAYAATHLMNHALGLISLSALETGRLAFLAVWRSPLEYLLFAALLVHPALALHKVWKRRTLRMPLSDWLQTGLGLAIPYYLVIHVLGTGIVHRVDGVTDSYAYFLNLIWPDGLQRQTELMIVIWVHGCIGVHHRLKLETWYRPRQPLFLTLAVLLPTLAFVGVVNASREIAARAQTDPAWIAALAKAQHWDDPQARSWIFPLEERLLWLIYGLILLVFLVKIVRRIVVARTGPVAIEFPDKHVVRVPRGTTVLEAAEMGRLPHASVCGGRGRCSTCRVRVTRGGDRLAPPSEREARVLKRIQAGSGVRLACQLRPSHAVQVTPLVALDRATEEVRRPMAPGQGVERELVVLFADLRGFTMLTEQRLPYDVVFLLNRWFALSGRAIEEAGGRIDKFIGDGVMALFGLDGGPERGARDALSAAQAIARGLERVSADMRGDLKEDLRVGVGIHAGSAIVGELGFGKTMGLTAIGDVVNVASRLETACKELRAEAVVSAEVFRLAGIDPPSAPVPFEARGRREVLHVVAIKDLAALKRPPLVVPA